MRTSRQAVARKKSAPATRSCCCMSLPRSLRDFAAERCCPQGRARSAQKVVGIIGGKVGLFLQCYPVRIEQDSVVKQEGANRVGLCRIDGTDRSVFALKETTVDKRPLRCLDQLGVEQCTI